MARYLDDLRTSSRFNRPFGMPRLNSEDPFDEVIPIVRDMKNEDMRRQQEMMLFQDTLRRRNTPPPIKYREPKKYVLGAGSGTGMLRPSTVEADNAAREANATRINMEFAAADQARKEKEAARASAEKIAANKLAAETLENKTQREFQAEQNRLNREQKGQPFLTDDPDNPGKQMAVRWNPATETLERIKYNGQTVTNLVKPGTPPKAGSMVQPKNLADIRSQAQEALEEIKNVMGENDELTPEGARAVGKSAVLNWMPTTKGYAGSSSIGRIKAQRVLGLIGQMKAQSRTGATGFGNMSNKDLAVLENAATRLDTGLDEATFRKELIRVRSLLRKILEDEGAEQAEKDRPGVTSTGKRPVLDVDAMLEKY